MSRRADILLNSFKTGFAIGEKKKDEQKQNALSEAYNILGDVGMETPDTIRDSASGEVVNLAPKAVALTPEQEKLKASQMQAIAAEKTKQAAAGIATGPVTTGYQQLQEQVGDFDIPQVSFTDHIANRQRARDILRRAKVGGKEVMEWDKAYNEQINSSARKYRDAAISYWQMGDYAKAASMVEAAYNFIPDGSDVKAEFIKNPKTNAMELHMGFSDSMSGESYQENAMYIPTPDKLAMISEKALDYGKGLGIQKDQQAIEMAEAAERRAEGKYKFWDQSKDDDLKLDRLFKAAGVENAAAQTAALNTKYLMSGFKSSKEAESSLKYEKALQSEMDRLALAGAKGLAVPDFRQDMSANATSLGRLTSGSMSTNEVINIAEYATTIQQRVDAQVQTAMENPRYAQLTEGARRTQVKQMRKELMFNTGFLRYSPTDGTVEMRRGANDDSWVPAPPRLYGGSPVTTQYSLKSNLINKLAAAPKADMTVINEIRKTLGLPDYGGSPGAAVTTASSATGAIPAVTETGTPGSIPRTPPTKTPAAKSRIKPGEVTLPPLSDSGALPTGSKKMALRTTTERRAATRLDNGLEDVYTNLKDIIRMRQYGKLTPELQIQVMSKRNSNGQTIYERLTDKDRTKLKGMLKDYGRVYGKK